MARPFHIWRPAVNVDLIVRSADGPLVISGNDPRWPLLARHWIEPVLYAGASGINYLSELNFEDGADPLNGAKIAGFQYMPENMSFFGAEPINGEPQPEDAADAVAGENYRYICCGYRLALRGWIASRVDNLNVDIELRWGDSEVRNSADARGAWTGLVAMLFDGRTELSDFLMYALHGKRLGDASWEYRGGSVEDPTGAFVSTSAVVTPWDGVDSGRVRLLITGGPPAWTIKIQYWDDAVPGWVDLVSTTADLQAYAPPGFEDYMLLNPALFHGATKVFPGALPEPPALQESWFRYISVSRFDPWVLDLCNQTYREFIYRLTEMGIAVPPAFQTSLQTVPAVDLQHYPEGHECGPEKLRDYDLDNGWGVLFNNRTSLFMRGIEDRKEINATTASTQYLPLVLSDIDFLGAEVPFTYVGRYKFKNMSAWPGDSVLVSFGYAGISATPSPAEGGIGLIWRADNGGELVLKHWDGIAADWLELVAPFSIEDYDDGLVDLAFSWTGNHGDSINRENYELRIVVDGVTVARALVPALLISTTWQASIGSRISVLGNSFEGHWFGGVTFYEPCTDMDIKHAFDEEGTDGFKNGNFEIAGGTGRPGEAEDWEWQSFQGEGMWAEFSAYRADLDTWRIAREGFEAGWFLGYSWAYTDEATRLAATGFTEGDVGGAAWQIDTNEIYILTGYAPIAWSISPVGENQEWMSSLANIVAKVFNPGIPNYESTTEMFSLWNGLPWLDAYNMVPPCEDTIGPGPTGFDGWYDHLYSTNDDPLAVESFEEAWDNDPLSVFLGQRWRADTAQGGRLRGAALTFPLTIPPNQNRIILLTDPEVGRLIYKPIMFSLPRNTYADLASLVSDLNAATSAELTGRGIEFGSWTDGSEQGIWFGWDGVSMMSVWFGFATLKSDMWRDGRRAIGFASFSPDGSWAGIGIPAWAYSVLPGGVDPLDRFLLDSWSANLIEISDDPIFGEYAIENSMLPAIFDIAIPRDTIIERFMLDGWFGISAIWVSDLSEVTLDPAMFDSGVADTEQFLDTEWPDEIFPT